MDPQQKLLLQCSYRALEDSGIPMEKVSGSRTGVYIGNNNNISVYFSTPQNSVSSAVSLTRAQQPCMHTFWLFCFFQGS